MTSNRPLAFAAHCIGEVRVSDQQVVVGVASAVGAANLQRIAAVSERVRVIDLAPLLYQEFSEARRPGQTPPPPYEGTATLAGLLADVETLLRSPPGTQRMPAAALTRLQSMRADGVADVRADPEDPAR